MPCGTSIRFGNRSSRTHLLGWKKAEILANLKLHPIDFCQKPGHRQAKVGGMGLDDSEMRHLILDVSDSGKHRV